MLREAFDALANAVPYADTWRRDGRSSAAAKTGAAEPRWAGRRASEKALLRAVD